MHLKIKCYMQLDDSGTLNLISKRLWIKVTKLNDNGLQIY